jgi:4-amino-4-deoxy-L-arabinose transferase-like glycosyltransferase
LQHLWACFAYMKGRLFTFFIHLSTKQLTWIAVLLCLPAFLINLGLIGFIGDEAIRTLVAFEMHESGNFIVPTLNGELYFNKPPLYNWFIYGLSQLFGHFGEWPTRLTTLICLGLFAWAIYAFVRRHGDQLMALSVMLMTLTCGRILFWDSMLGLIDIGFSAVVYLNFMLLYQLGKQQQWKKLFIISYLLFSIAFMLKGLPAVVFQGLSIFAALWFFKSFKKQIFSIHHILGAIIGIIPVALYYVLYAQQVSLADVFATLSDQSLQRTGTHHGVGKTILHVFTFPAEQLYHFLPWSLIVLMFLHPRMRTWIRENDFIRFNLLMIAVNIPVYWLSVQVYPRYLLMFVPLFFTVGYYLIKRSQAETQRWWNIMYYINVTLAAIALAVIIILPLIPQLKEVPGLYLIWIVCGIIMGGAVLGLQKDKARMFIWMSISLLVVRIVFNLVVLPVRATEFQENVTRADCLRLAETHGDRSWYIYGETETHQVARCYTSIYKNEIIRVAEQLDADANAYYLVDKALYPALPGITVDSLILERGQRISLMDFNTGGIR